MSYACRAARDMVLSRIEARMNPWRDGLTSPGRTDRSRENHRIYESERPSAVPMIPDATPAAVLPMQWLLPGLD
ncbi:conserved hypothetical protein [Mesorhizobium plurifarium]|uniref:Uncharacterized protein n=1 Tax=Mesorhizobium plurifarium TaxID=69974 RepID=A0A090EV62_MESPL|nr:conserved hypothetical protein [Mesorhizobium plurifarium]